MTEWWEEQSVIIETEKTENFWEAQSVSVKKPSFDPEQDKQEIDDTLDIASNSDVPLSAAMQSHDTFHRIQEKQKKAERIRPFMAFHGVYDEPVSLKPIGVAGKEIVKGIARFAQRDVGATFGGTAYNWIGQFIEKGGQAVDWFSKVGSKNKDQIYNPIAESIIATGHNIAKYGRESREWWIYHGTTGWEALDEDLKKADPISYGAGRLTEGAASSALSVLAVYLSGGAAAPALLDKGIYINRGLLALSTMSAAGGFEHAQSEGENFAWSTVQGLADGAIEYVAESSFLEGVGKGKSALTAGFKEGGEEFFTGMLQNTRATILENENKGMGAYESAKDAIIKSLKQAPWEVASGFIGGYGMQGGANLANIVSSWKANVPIEAPVADGIVQEVVSAQKQPQVTGPAEVTPQKPAEQIAVEGQTPPTGVEREAKEAVPTATGEQEAGIATPEPTEAAPKVSEKKPKSMKVFHGTPETITVEQLEKRPSKYQFGGAIGEGIYFGQNRETAEFYGKNVIETEIRPKSPLFINPESPNFRIAPEIEEQYLEKGAYDSILIGERIPPFDVKIGDTWHEVRDEETLYEIGALAKEAGHDAVIVEDLREGRSIRDEEILVLDDKIISHKPSVEKKPEPAVVPHKLPTKPVVSQKAEKVSDKPIPTKTLKVESNEDVGPLVEAVEPTEPQKGELKERKFVTSVKEQIPSAATRVAGQYMPRSTDVLSMKAKNLIKDDITTAESMARTGSNDASVATASELIKHYNELAQQAEKRKDKATANAMLDKVANITHETAAKLTELGRAVQAAYILSLDTPEGMLRFAAQTIQRHNEGILEKRRGKHRGKRTVARRTAKKPRTRLVSKESFEKARSRLLNQNVVRAGIDPKGFADLATVGVYHIQEGLIEFGEWSAQMVKDFGDNIKPHLERVWADANQMVDSSSIRGLVPDLNTEQTEHILKKAKDIEGMPDGENKAQATQELRNYISDLVPTPLMDKLIAIWKAGLLTGIKTSGLNTFSNWNHGVTEVVKDVPGVAVDSVVSLFTKERSLALTARGYKGGIVEGFWKGWRYLKTGFDERNIAAKLDYKRVHMGKSRFARWVQSYEEHVFRMMGAEDQPFYYGAKARSLMSQAIAQAKNVGLKGKEAADFVHKLVENPTDDMIRYAALDAETAVFQNKTLLGDIAKSLQKTRTGQVIVPFGRTPSAVATQIIHYSPIGAVTTIKDNIGKGNFDQRLFSQGMGRAITGTALLWLGGQIFKAGVLSLGRPKGERERKLWELEGRKENAIKIGDKWRSVHVLGPAGNVLLIGGYFQEALESTGSPTEAIGTAAIGGAKSFTEQTFVRGVNQAITALTEPEWGAKSWFTSMAGSTVPTIVGDTARALDSTERRSTGPITRIAGRIPVLRNTLEPRVDVFGQDLPRYGGNPLEVMIDPTRPVKIKQDIVVDELRRLWDKDIKVSPTLLGNKDGYKSLTKEQNTALWRRAGQLVYHELFSLIHERRYSRRDDHAKGDMIEDGVSDAKTRARAEIANEILSEVPRQDREVKREELRTSGLITREVERAM